MGAISLSKRFSAKSTGRTMSTVAEEPRSLPTSGFQTIELDKPVEEEELPDYRADWFYPVRLVFQKDGFNEGFVRGAIIRLLKALDFLHAYGEVVHTGIARLACCQSFPC